MPRINGRFEFYLAQTNVKAFIRVLKLMGEEFRIPFGDCCYLVVPFYRTKPELKALSSLTEGAEFGNSSVRLVLMYDSGGYEVEIGKLSFSQLLLKLQRAWETCPLPNHMVLPDNPLTSADSEDEIKRKVDETIEGSLFFIRRYRDLVDRMVAPIHGVTLDTVLECAKVFYDEGVRFFAFGSLEAIVGSKSVTNLTPQAIEVLEGLSRFCRERKVKLHIFGVGSIDSIVSIRQAGIWFSSVDSSSLVRQTAACKVLFPEAKLHLQALHYIRLRDIYETVRETTRHRCPFCESYEKLVKSFDARYAHNLIVLFEVLSEIIKETDAIAATEDDTVNVRKVSVHVANKVRFTAARVGKLLCSCYNNE